MIHLVLALVAGIAFPESSTHKKIELYIHKHIPSKWSSQKKIEYSRQLATNIVRESKRNNLDPYVFTVIGRIESNYRYWVSRKGDDSHGVFQIIRNQKSTRQIAYRLAGCNFDHLRRRYWRLYAGVFNRRWKHKAHCDDQRVGLARLRSGYFSTKELKSKNQILNTYIAGIQIKKHLDSAQNFRYVYWIRGCSLSKQTQNRILRYSAFNSGYRKPRWYYMYRICKYYKELVNG